MEKELVLKQNENGEFVIAEYEEPYMVIECPTKEDYEELQKAVEYYCKAKEKGLV